MNQLPIMRGLEGGGEGTEERARKAWASVADGYREGLSLLCAGDPGYARMHRCLLKASRLAGERRLALAPGPRQDRGQALG